MRNNQIGVASLRALNGKTLKALTEPVIIFTHRTPIAAVVPYETYLKWQKLIDKFRED